MPEAPVPVAAQSCALVWLTNCAAMLSLHDVYVVTVAAVARLDFPHIIGPLLVKKHLIIGAGRALVVRDQNFVTGKKIGALLTVVAGKPEKSAVVVGRLQVREASIFYDNSLRPGPERLDKITALLVNEHALDAFEAGILTMRNTESGRVQTGASSYRVPLSHRNDRTWHTPRQEPRPSTSHPRTSMLVDRR